MVDPLDYELLYVRAPELRAWEQEQAAAAAAAAPDEDLYRLIFGDGD
jgi:hypothetical protein